eukprot:SAG31_NODE_2937_length_4889_cov_3.571399_3_plen_256_part_00
MRNFMTERQRLPTGLHGLAAGLGNELYLTFTFLTIGAGREPDTALGKMLLAVMSFFVLVATSMYTANLATQLLLSAQVSNQYTGIDDIISAGKSVCVAHGTAMFRLVQDNYPTAQIIPVHSAHEGLAKIRSGECGGEVKTEMAAKYVVIQGDNCDIAEVGPRLLPNNFIFGVSPLSTSADAPAINYWITYLREHGFIRGLTEEYFDNMNECGSADAQTDISSLVIDIWASKCSLPSIVCAQFATTREHGIIHIHI